jgi:tRNA(Arg) A34 adenosine deaminase TadA
MLAAIKEGTKNLKDLTGGPFGACLVKSGKIIAVGRNGVLKNDSTAHAEINAIRKACKKLKTYDLSGCVIYSTTEPCPMCFSAIHWARIKTIVYGTNIADVEKRGFNELAISNVNFKKLGKSPVRIIQAFRDDCLKFLQAWDKLENKIIY